MSMKRLGLLALTMGAMMTKEAAESMSGINYRLDTYRPYVGGFNYFRGMKIGGVNKHFNKKRHGKKLRRKHNKP